MFFGSNHNATKTKASPIVIHNGGNQPSTGPIKRIHLEGEQRVIRQRAAKQCQSDDEQPSIKSGGKFHRGSHDEVAMMEVMLPKRFGASSISFHLFLCRSSRDRRPRESRTRDQRARSAMSKTGDWYHPTNKCKNAMSCSLKKIAPTANTNCQHNTS